LHADDVLVMYARAVEEAASTLRRLRHDEWGDFSPALMALTLALVAAEAYKELAIPLFLASLYVGARGLGALWRRWDLVERLGGDSDAYAIDEIRTWASRQATEESRRSYAASIRRVLRDRSAYDPRIEMVAEELRALARELGDRTLAFEPAHAVACRRFFADPAQSALLDSNASVQDLRANNRRIRLGFSTRPASGPETPRHGRNARDKQRRPPESPSKRQIMWNGSH
jgi:hypothetical protein